MDGYACLSILSAYCWIISCIAMLESISAPTASDLLMPPGDAFFTLISRKWLAENRLEGFQRIIGLVHARLDDIWVAGGFYPVGKRLAQPEGGVENRRSSDACDPVFISHRDSDFRAGD